MNGTGGSTATWWPAWLGTPLPSSLASPPSPPSPPSSPGGSSASSNPILAGSASSSAPPTAPSTAGRSWSSGRTASSQAGSSWPSSCPPSPSCSRSPFSSPVSMQGWRQSAEGQTFEAGQLLLLLQQLFSHNQGILRWNPQSPAFRDGTTHISTYLLIYGILRWNPFSSLSSQSWYMMEAHIHIFVVQGIPRWSSLTISYFTWCNIYHLCTRHSEMESINNVIFYMFIFFLQGILSWNPESPATFLKRIMNLELVWINYYVIFCFCICGAGFLCTFVWMVFLYFLHFVFVFPTLCFCISSPDVTSWW